MILDSSAMVALFLAEPGYETVFDKPWEGPASRKVKFRRLYDICCGEDSGDATALCRR